MDESIVRIFDPCLKCAHPKASGAAEELAESENTTLCIRGRPFVGYAASSDSLLRGYEAGLKCQLLLPELI
ncbi:hypothetical protein GCM10023159_13930 [Brevibacterium yomogidense]